MTAAPSVRRHTLRCILSPVVTVVAILYFLIDALFLPIVRALVARLARLRVFVRLAGWIRALGPYPTLALFVVPLVLLEPVKPVGFYLIGTGRFTRGVLVLAFGEIVKITLVERLFHMSRDKLMTIPAFAWCYTRITGWLGWLKALPAWQGVLRRFHRVKAAARRLYLGAVAWVRVHTH